MISRGGSLVGWINVGLPGTEGSLKCLLTHTIHGTGIFTNMWLNCMVNVGKYTMH